MYGKLYSCMKTTVDLPEELVIAAKKAAAERRTTIRDLVERGLRRELAAAAGSTPLKRRIKWVTVDGGLPSGLDVSDRAEMMEWLTADRHDRR